jgi:hypothetical protein
MSDESDAAAAGRELGERMRREVADLATGLPPVPEVMREGRRMRRRRHLTVTAACLVAVSLPLTVAAFPTLLPDRDRQGSATAEAGGAPRVVEPYDRIDVGHGWSLTLRPAAREGFVAGQGYALSRTEDFEDAVQRLADDNNPRVTGDTLGDDLSGFLTITSNGTIVSGTWRTASGLPPRQVRVTVNGEVSTAELVRTPESPGWGVYYAVFDERPEWIETDWSSGDLTGMTLDAQVELITEAEQENPVATLQGANMGSDSNIDSGDESYLEPRYPPE